MKRVAMLKPALTPHLASALTRAISRRGMWMHRRRAVPLARLGLLELRHRAGEHYYAKVTPLGRWRALGGRRPVTVIEPGGGRHG